MTHNKETYEFKTEVKQFMNLVINSLYSTKEIFLRELISNASDALDRLSFRSQTDPDVLGDDTQFKIKIIPDQENRTLTVSDNGLGMTYDEMVENLGTIARSGTAAFLEALEKSKKEDTLAPELIGQFGVGFYSSFIVAETVTVLSRSVDSETGIRWESSGDGAFTIEPTEKQTRGTDVILKLKDLDEGDPDFTQEWTIRQTVKRHSDFVRYPIVMDVEREVSDEEGEAKDQQVLDKDGKPIEGEKKTEIVEETLNSMKAIWARNKKDISEEEYTDFYSHISHDWNPPLTHLHLKMEGVTEYSALLFIPSQAPFDLFSPERHHGVQLYCRRVFIMDDCKEILPEYLRFIKGVVDAPDLNLNISREILQQDALVRNIRKNLTKKILDKLANMDPEEYEKFYNEFGAVLKEGIHTDWDNRDKIIELVRFKTSKSEDKWVSMKDYVANMKPDQEFIYYLTGDNRTTLLNSPHLEALKEKDYEVLLMTEPVDEFVIQAMPEYDGKQLKSAEKGDLGLDQVDDETKNKYEGLFEKIKSHLEDEVKDVKPSSHLKESVACLSGDTYDMSAYMEKLLKASGQSVPQTKRILELNLNHPLLAKIQNLYENNSDDETLKDYSRLLLDLAVVSEGGKVENPARFSKMVGELMARGIAA
ncbi:MAG TPA: molecular chaperone HtpG [Desulfosalsimonadaceae bacterium]|nr:molecular chaperone HtpG [Desulfosalsimonadaceae bacterium]